MVPSFVFRVIALRDGLCDAMIGRRACDAACRRAPRPRPCRLPRYVVTTLYRLVCVVCSGAALPTRVPRHLLVCAPLGRDRASPRPVANPTVQRVSSFVCFAVRYMYTRCLFAVDGDKIYAIRRCNLRVSCSSTRTVTGCLTRVRVPCLTGLVASTLETRPAGASWALGGASISIVHSHTREQPRSNQPAPSAADISQDLPRPGHGVMPAT